MAPKATSLSSDQIPEDVVVGCPKENAAVRVKTKCATCPHLEAIACLNPDERVPWVERHRVLCGYRRVITISRLVE